MAVCNTTINDSNAPYFSGDSVTLYYIQSSTNPVVSEAITVTVTLTGPNGYSQTKSGTSTANLPYTAVTFNGIVPGTTYNVSSQTYTTTSCPTQMNITGRDAVLTTITSPNNPVCSQKDLTSTVTIVYNTTGLTVTFPLSANVFAQAGNVYNMVLTRGNGSTTHASATITGLKCGTSGTVSVLVLEGANQCIETFDFKMPVCTVQNIACPVQFTIDKLTCTSFEVSWDYGSGTIPDTMNVQVYDEITGNVIYTNNSWSTNNKILNSADLGIVLNPLQSIGVKLSTGPMPDLLLFNDFFIPDCSTYDCPENEPRCCYKKVDWVLFFILIIMMLFWFLILPRLLRR